MSLKRNCDAAMNLTGWFQPLSGHHIVFCSRFSVEKDVKVLKNLASAGADCVGVTTFHMNTWSAGVKCMNNKLIIKLKLDFFLILHNARIITIYSSPEPFLKTLENV